MSRSGFRSPRRAGVLLALGLVPLVARPVAAEAATPPAAPAPAGVELVTLESPASPLIAIRECPAQKPFPSLR